MAGWLVFAGACLWAALQISSFDSSEWVFDTAGDTEKTALMYSEVIRILAFTGLGALILTSQPRNRAGLLCLAPIANPIADAYFMLTAGADRGMSPWLWSDQIVNVVAMELSLFLPVFFLPFFLPDGRLPHRVWRLVVLPVFAVVVVQELISIEAYHDQTPPSEVVTQVLDILAWVWTIGPYAALLSLVHRLFLTHGRARVQVAWIMVATWGLYFGRAIPWYMGDLVQETNYMALFVGRLIGLAIFVVACGVAILRHDLVALNPLLRRILLAVVLVTVLAGAYLALRALLGTEPVPAAASAVGLALVSPVLYRWLRGGVNRLVYGRRGSPADITAELVRRIAAAAGPSDVLGGLVEAMCGAVPLIAVDAVLTSDRGELLRVSRGDPDAVAVSESIPLGFQGTCLGRVEIASGHPLDPVDRALLKDLAAAAAAPVAAAHRSAELQRARQELITAREQERRRIARDLHDGVGPVLSGLGYTLDSLRASLTDPNAQRVGARARGQVKEASQLVRRVARELRPSGIDQLGLVGAMRELAALHTGPELTVHVSVDEPGRCDTPARPIEAEAITTTGPGAQSSCNTAGGLGELCAATEVAAYAIVAEAVTNTARHAHATRCDISLAPIDGGIMITVTDNGTGLQNGPPGVGRASMTERAEELGGWCTITTQPSGGTQVTVHLPLPADTTKNVPPSMGTVAQLVGAASSSS